MKPPRLAMLALVTVALCGCGALGIGGHDDGELVANRAKWDSKAPDSYSFVMQRSCFCGAEVRDAVRIVVDDGTRTSAVYVETGEPVGPNFLDLFPTMDGVFDLLATAHAEADSIRVRYHASLGYPTEAQIDYLKNAADDELTFTITDVRPR